MAPYADKGTYSFWEHLYKLSPHKTHEEANFLMENPLDALHGGGGYASTVPCYSAPMDGRKQEHRTDERTELFRNVRCKGGFTRSGRGVSRLW